MNEFFRKFAEHSAAAIGSPWAFIASLAITVLWAAVGPFVGFSDTWQLWINTGTTVLTFLIVFLIQNTQNRDAKAIHLKLDELLRTIGPARNMLIDLEKCSEEELAELEAQFRQLRKRV